MVRRQEAAKNLNSEETILLHRYGLRPSLAFQTISKGGDQWVAQAISGND